MKQMYRILYWTATGELRSFNTIAASYKETIDKFIIETGIEESNIYNIKIRK